ncbi:bifunctional diaminohydroxyphosphoribosylaminopyrimidine deaminase/5-amino-6-(5-phosphoribosylamino)uracil reductase [Leptospira fletcheri]|uniref:Riboflavin biosynthesis protein RibD n=1 Tax=Leptospira fletcheri TaxID=2484981 RepID=A0A4R9GFS6_9LEPT|nr:dihydrofolate reductase family protein [Leptospira fletcheri]TGK10017.1 bifunctional diaminohydroxyphosphoribosylaminopyrimidine deaminase/5-amino-6-(5-phosphoribosylamino)uracil reductase [Leptospira fletcheri]
MKHTLPKEIREELLRSSFLSLGFSSPNPPVACVLADPSSGRILASGRTQVVGGNHAEREAYRRFREKFPEGLPPHDTYVTLEPCSHFGRTPPCLDLFLEAKPKTLYYGWRDPNPLVKKKDGLAELKDAGVNVVPHPELSEIASVFLFGFSSAVLRSKPSILLKSSLSADGFYSSDRGLKEKISSTVSDFFLSVLRAKMDAILVGPKTVRIDLPKLNFRAPKKQIPVFKKIDILKSDTAPLPGGFSGLISELFRFAGKEEVISEHATYERDYQPLRVFFLPEESEVPEDFWKTQEELNSKYDSKKIAFFLSDDIKYDTASRKRLEDLSEGRVISYPKHSFKDLVLERLAGWGVNIALVEGGNFLYSEFSREMQIGDACLQVRSGAIHLEQGRRPDWKTELCPDEKFRVDSDEWEILKICSPD